MTGRLFIAVLAGVSLVAAACGNSTKSSSDTTAPAAVTTAPAADTTTASATTAAGSTDTTAVSATTTQAFVPLTGVPGVTDKEIRFAVVGTKSNNPLGTCVLDCYRTGIEAYFAYRNSQGGLFGRKLVVSKQLDDELSQNQVKALELVSSNDVFGDFNATLLASGWGDLQKAGIPTYGWGINAAEASGRDAIFQSVGTQCANCTGRGVPYAASLVKATKIASLGYGISQNSKLCAQADAASVEKYSSATGEKSVYVNDNLAYGLPNGIGPEVTAMKKAGVDFIATCIDLNGMKTLAQELDRQGMQSVTLYHPNTYNQDFVKAAGSLFEGDFVGVSFRPFEADPGSSNLQAYLDWMGKAGSKLTELAMTGWINADLAYKGIQAAGPNFDRAKVVAATNTFTAYSADGIIVPINWTKQHNPPTPTDPSNGYAQECVALVKVVSGAFQTVAPKDKPFLCWPQEDKSWSEPVPTDFK
jgi:ABC-type branched-subunit amino acid transport system substrate-binding protein